MPVVVTWDHVHLRSPDPEATAAWLQDILGGEIIRAPGGSTSSSAAPRCSSRRCAGDGVNTPPVTPYQGLDHFGLTVKDIDAVAAEIKAKGVEFTQRADHDPARRAHLLHPRTAGHLDRAAGARQEIRLT